VKADPTRVLFSSRNRALMRLSVLREPQPMVGQYGPQPPHLRGQLSLFPAKAEPPRA
jgi:hypothetical protein